MKRYFSILIILFASFQAFSQSQVDALRYSRLSPTGTARFTAMGGAYSSLGGDFSGISLNPAGLGVYRSSEFTITPSLVYTGTNSTFLDNTESDFKYNFNLGNIGYVGTILINDEDIPLKSMSFGFGYNNLNNFHQITEIEGVNNINSLTDHLASRANGINFNELEGYYLSPAWNTYLIDPLDSELDNQYISAFDSYGQTQRMNIQTSGHMGEYVFSMGLNFDHNLYIGASLGIQDVDFLQTIYYSESDPEDKITNIKSFNYTDELSTEGTGYNFKIGAIYRPIEWMRIGGSIHTPTFYNLYDEYKTNFTTHFNDSTLTASSALGIYDYNLTSPFRAVGGMSFTIKNFALISVDYEFLDYSISRLRADNYDFNRENDAIESAYVASHNLKIGAEYKIGLLAIRGGYSYSTSPFASDQLNSENNIMTYSGGIGLRTKGFFFDMSYQYKSNSEKYLLYEGFNLDSPESTINTTRHSVLATIGFRF